MPLFYNQQLNASTSVALWENTEVESFFYDHLQLSPCDHDAIANIKLPQRRLERLGCRMALSQLLKKQNINIKYTKNGQPFIDECYLSFAHSGKISAAAISTEKIGIDIEFQKDRIYKLYHKFISIKELEQCNTQNIKDLYYYWCVKEAAFKWYAKGDVDFIEDIYVDKSSSQVSIKHHFEQNIYHIEINDLMLVVVNGAPIKNNKQQQREAI